MARKRSKYDEFFEIDAKNEKATCKKCGETIKCKNRATTGMKTHLEKKHSIKNLDEVEESENPPAKKSKSNENSGGQTTINRYFPISAKEPIEDLVAKEAVNGASFRYIAKSFLIKKGLCALGFEDQVPNHHSSVSKLIDKSAENHRSKLITHLKSLIDEGQRFCIVTDEWTCSGKKKKYINVTLHMKGERKLKTCPSPYTFDVVLYCVMERYVNSRLFHEKKARFSRKTHFSLLFCGFN